MLQHYVPQFYLKGWLDPHSLNLQKITPFLWCVDLEKGEVRKKNPKNLARIKDLYKFSDTDKYSITMDQLDEFASSFGWKNFKKDIREMPCDEEYVWDMLGNPNSREELYKLIEGPSSSIISKLRTPLEYNIFMTMREKIILSMFLSMQISRTPSFNEKAKKLGLL